MSSEEHRPEEAEGSSSMSTASKTGGFRAQIRKSCQFCRRRKIRCKIEEGQERCVACIKRPAQDCVFAERGAPDDPPPPRPRIQSRQHRRDIQDRRGQGPSSAPVRRPQQAPRASTLPQGLPIAVQQAAIWDVQPPASGRALNYRRASDNGIFSGPSYLSASEPSTAVESRSTSLPFPSVPTLARSNTYHAPMLRGQQQPQYQLYTTPPQEPGLQPVPLTAQDFLATPQMYQQAAPGHLSPPIRESQATSSSMSAQSSINRQPAWTPFYSTPTVPSAPQAFSYYPQAGTRQAQQGVVGPSGQVYSSYPSVFAPAPPEQPLPLQQFLASSQGEADDPRYFWSPEQQSRYYGNLANSVGPVSNPPTQESSPHSSNSGQQEASSSSQPSRQASSHQFSDAEPSYTEYSTHAPPSQAPAQQPFAYSYLPPSQSSMNLPQLQQNYNAQQLSPHFDLNTGMVQYAGQPPASMEHHLSAPASPGNAYTGSQPGNTPPPRDGFGRSHSTI